MVHQIHNWLINAGVAEEIAKLLSQVVLLVMIIMVGGLLKILLRLFINRHLGNWVEKSNTLWDDIFYESKFFHHLGFLPPLILLYFTASLMPDLSDWIERISLALIAYFSARALEATLWSVNHIYNSFEIAKRKPIKGYIQVGKIIVWMFALILIGSALMKSSPMLLLGGLGAFSAVLLLVFKDTLLGLLASIQFMTNDMVRLGDWIEMQEYNADGEVIDISVHTVKVSNWDKTISTIPTYAMLSNSFKNWRGMELSGGRRIKRAIFVDLNSIRFCDLILLSRLNSLKYIRDYQEEKVKEIKEDDLSHHVDTEDIFAGHNITNIGAYRAYVRGYIANHPKINPQMDIIVRLLAPTEKGLPLEVYAFSSDKRWEDYEDVQAEIFDHLLAILPEFDLAAYQNPSGLDIRTLHSYQLSEPSTLVGQTV